VFLLGLLIGLAIPAFPHPRLALSAHMQMTLNALVALVFGLLWREVRWSGRGERVAFLGLVGALYCVVAAHVLAAVWSAGAEMLPIASGGASGTPVQEGVIKVALILSALGLVVTTTLALRGIRRDGPQSGAADSAALPPRAADATLPPTSRP